MRGHNAPADDVLLSDESGYDHLVAEADLTPEGGARDTMDKRYPLLFGYRDLVEGLDFVAGVEITGRALLTECEGDVCLYGVNPGGLAGVGDTRQEAISDFREGYRTVLFDLAAEAQSFEDFQTQVDRFIHESTAAAVADWEAAVEAVRAGAVEDEEWPKVHTDDVVIGVRVQRLRIGDGPEPEYTVRPQPAHNVPDRISVIAA